MKKLFNVILICNKTWHLVFYGDILHIECGSYRVTIPVCSTLRNPTSLSLTTWPSSALGWSFHSCRSFPEIRRLSRHPMVWWWTLCSDSASPRRSGQRLPESWTPWGEWRSPCVAWTYPQVNRHTDRQTIKKPNTQTNTHKVTVKQSNTPTNKQNRQIQTNGQINTLT